MREEIEKFFGATDELEDKELNSSGGRGRRPVAA
jgi:hypothetical protein